MATRKLRAQQATEEVSRVKEDTSDTEDNLFNRNILGMRAKKMDPPARQAVCYLKCDCNIEAFEQKSKANLDPATATAATEPQQSGSIVKAESTIAEYPVEHKVHYLRTEAAVNQALAFVQQGPIGFDTEFVPRKASALEAFLDELFMNIPGSKKSVITALHALQLEADEQFVIEWDEVGLCVVQIAKGDDVWVLNMNCIRAFPAELRRILLDPAIIKAGVGMGSDIPVLWRDLGTDVNSFVDCGLMARLALTEQYQDTGFTWLSMKSAVQDVLGLTISKDMQRSNWKGDVNGELSTEQKKYAAIDAHASLRLYEHLARALEVKAVRIGVHIPSDWYTFNGRYGESVRTQMTHWNRYTPWTVNVCPWFFLGKFQGYQYSN
ncbi:ribonuclease H-like domain-containing protein [Mycena crocata]|nr:ribonuclease H-like domain-containing protein [Mycena crocata]